MKIFYLVSIELPEWADEPDKLDLIRDEIEQHAGAAAAFYTRATHVSAKCEPLHPHLAAALEKGMAT